MRTTLDLDEDVLLSAKAIARREGKTAGQVLSELARRALTAGAAGTTDAPGAPSATGFSPFASRGIVVTDELIDRLRDDGAY